MQYAKKGSHCPSTQTLGRWLAHPVSYETGNRSSQYRYETQSEQPKASKAGQSTGGAAGGCGAGAVVLADVA
eukprot:scaffold2278_cov124-Isochrysis_galbana.AAC.3